jgi:hypothetical protein
MAAIGASRLALDTPVSGSASVASVQPRSAAAVQPRFSWLRTVATLAGLGSRDLESVLGVTGYPGMATDPRSGAVRSWERCGSDDARVCALRRGHCDRMWPHDLPGRLLPGSSFSRTLCCGPGCHEFSRERSQRSSMPNTFRIHQPGLATAGVCAGQRTLECGQPGCLQNGRSPDGARAGTADLVTHQFAVAVHLSARRAAS